jgi:hypothetical protein
LIEDDGAGAGGCVEMDFGVEGLVAIDFDAFDGESVSGVAFVAEDVDAFFAAFLGFGAEGDAVSAADG